jgi:hypothetical protein
MAMPLVAGLLPSLVAAAAVLQTPRTPMTATTPATVTVSGAFEVKMTPQASVSESAQIGRFALDKTYHGDLEATAAGEMLAVMTGEKGSAGYVAVERVTGTLGGRRGTFALQHSATMNRGTPDLTITVIPDSGTDGLAGLTGRMQIRIEPGGKHFYDFTYTLPPAAR